MWYEVLAKFTVFEVVVISTGVAVVIAVVGALWLFEYARTPRRRG